MRERRHVIEHPDAKATSHITPRQLPRRKFLKGLGAGFVAGGIAAGIPVHRSSHKKGMREGRRIERKPLSDYANQVAPMFIRTQALAKQGEWAEAGSTLHNGLLQFSQEIEARNTRALIETMRQTGSPPDQIIHDTLKKGVHSLPKTISDEQKEDLRDLLTKLREHDKGNETVTLFEEILKHNKK